MRIWQFVCQKCYEIALQARKAILSAALASFHKANDIYEDGHEVQASSIFATLRSKPIEAYMAEGCRTRVTHLTRRTGLR